ncbi:MAG TPA: hypothetical protein VMS17_14000 [Gemmataceae bacterium]|nr:hypothetical protein [Gemmataceae bacterium]
MFTALRFLRKTVQSIRRRRYTSSRPVRRTPRLLLEGLETRTVPSASPLASPLSVVVPLAGSGPASAPFAPIEIAGAYSMPSSVSNPNNTTIAIVDAYSDPNIAGNLATFDAQWGVSAPPSFKQVNETGGTRLPAGDANWGLEISLDVEWAHAMDPTANILLVEASSSSINDLMTAVGYAASHASVVSMSWGAGEFSGETAFDTGSGGVSGFKGFANYPNTTFVASAGDSGSAVEWPSVSPDVVSVGGTTLSVNETTSGSTTTYSYGSESAWADGGGGVSSYEGKPTYQNGAQSYSTRTTPDVSYDANPNSGVYVYDTYRAGGWYEVGGTSAGAPQWSAVVALADQQRATALNTTTVETTLYANPQDLHDVTTGSNGHSATVGYDLATGLGSPNGSAVVSALTKASLLSPSASQGSSTSSGGTKTTTRNPGTQAATLALIEPAADAVVTTTPSSAAASSFSVHTVTAVAAPASTPAAVTAPWANSSWQSGGGGGVIAASPGGDGASSTDASAPTGVVHDGAGNMPWIGSVFSEALRRLQLPLTAPTPVSPAAPGGHSAPHAPMLQPAAPTPSGKIEGALPLEQIELYAVPAAVGLMGAGFELEERRRRERLLEKPR